MTRRGWAVVLGGLVILVGCGDGDSGGTLLGTWDLIAYSEHGVAATASGSAVFGGGGEFTITAEITYPGEPPDTIQVNGTWSMQGDRATLTTSEDTGVWLVEFTGEEATLTLVGPAPTNVIQLRRRGP